MKRVYFILGAILLLAFGLRIWDVGNRALFGDEAAYAFRAVGYLDYLGTSFQTTPVEWYANEALPWWTRLSFHDHPPLFFLVAHWFFNFLGDTAFAARLPSALAGTASVLLIYFLVKKLFEKETLAFGAALLFAVDGAMAGISRTVLMEPLLILLILFNIFCFFKYLEDRRWWWVFGVSLGLVALTKYIGLFILPVYFIYLLIYRRGVFRDRAFYAAGGLALLLFSPVMVYNFFLFLARGHFDLQLAYFLGQETPEWTGLLGKAQDPFSEFFYHLFRSYGWAAPTAALLGVSYSLWWFLKQKNERPMLVFWWLYLIFATILFIFIGSAERFLTLYGPVFVIFTAILFFQMFVAGKFWKLTVMFLGIAFLILQGRFFLEERYWSQPDYGVAELDQYLEKEFGGKVSAVVPATDNLHLSSIGRKFAEAQDKDLPVGFFMMIYNDNVEITTLQWIFYRRFFYHSIPMFFVENFFDVLRERGTGFYKGFDLYFVQSTENTLINPAKADKKAGEEFEAQIRRQGIRPVKEIYGSHSLLMFKVYKFKIEDLF